MIRLPGRHGWPGLRFVRRRERIRSRWRKTAGGIAFCALSLAACFLVARYLTTASWPLENADVVLVFVAGGAYLASFGFRALGWQRVFPSRQRPDRARCLAACGASAASGTVLPFRLDYVVKIALLRRLHGVTLGLDTILLSIVTLGIVDAVAMLPLAVVAISLSGSVFLAPLSVVVIWCLGCTAILLAGPRLVRLPFLHRWRPVSAVFSGSAKAQLSPARRWSPAGSSSAAGLRGP